MDQPTADAGRGSPEAWLEVAYDSLRDAGVDSVRILPLAKKLNLSRTSFYWFFKDREELLAALLERWRAKNTGNWVKQTEAYAETICEAVLNVFDCWLDDRIFDSRFEAAMRSWALQSPEIAAEIQMADQLRIAALTQLFERYEYEPISADVRARAIYLTQMGYISMKSEEELSVRMMRIAEYVEVFTGRRPEDRELDRFFMRHHYQAG
jgi:AcrR family transcriptional regulator